MIVLYSVWKFCNNGKTKCRHCGDTSHTSFKCLLTPRTEKKCFRCFSVSHMIDQCPNGVVCHHCGQPGHRESRCEAKLKDDAPKPTTSDDAKRTKPIAAENSVVTSKQETTSSTSGVEDIQSVSHPV